jgi:hypothetical protein
MILWTTILDRIEKIIKPDDNIRFIDIRYLQSWITKYPNCFPKFIQKNQHNIVFNSNKLRYEFYRTK